MNYIICPVVNNLKLTQKAVDTFMAQDIGNVGVILLDNASVDGTKEWAMAHPGILLIHFGGPRSVSYSWNFGLSLLFSQGEAYVLVVNNDVELRPDTYRRLAEDGGGFVTAVGVDDVGKIDDIGSGNKRPHPDFSCYLIRKEVWEKVGPFDEKFLGAYAEDWDYHCRLHQAGITAECIDLPFYHLGAGTVKSHQSIASKIHAQAQANRDYFAQKWGMKGGSPEYYKFFESEPPRRGQPYGPVEVSAPRRSISSAQSCSCQPMGC